MDLRQSHAVAPLIFGHGISRSLRDISMIRTIDGLREIRSYAHPCDPVGTERWILSTAIVRRGKKADENRAVEQCQVFEAL